MSLSLFRFHPRKSFSFRALHDSSIVSLTLTTVSLGVRENSGLREAPLSVPNNRVSKYVVDGLVVVRIIFVIIVVVVVFVVVVLVGLVCKLTSFLSEEDVDVIEFLVAFPIEFRTGVLNSVELESKAVEPEPHERLNSSIML